MTSFWEQWDTPLSVEERGKLLDAVVDAVKRRGLETPVALAVELNRPLGFAAAQGLIIFTPLLAPLVGLDRLQQMARLLQDTEALDLLLQRLESPTANAPSPSTEKDYP